MTRTPLGDWLDANGRLHRFLGVKDGKAQYKVEVPSSRLLALPDLYSGADSPATYYSSTADGRIRHSGDTYSTVQSAATGTSVSNTNVVFAVGQTKVSTTYYIDRGVVFFDTSGLPDTAEISAAALRLYSGFDDSATDFDLTVVSYTGASPITVDDFDAFGTTDFGHMNTSDFAGIEEANDDIALNASGIAAISLTGTTAFGLRSSRDIAATQPTGAEQVNICSRENDGTNTAPTLIITYAINVTIAPPAAYLAILPAPGPMVTTQTDVTVTAPAGYLSLYGAAPAWVGVVLNVTLAPPPVCLPLWPNTPTISANVGISVPAGYLSIVPLAPAGIIAGTGASADAPPAYLTLYPCVAVHETPVIRGRPRVVRLRPSHWFSSRRDIVRR